MKAQEIDKFLNFYTYNSYVHSRGLKNARLILQNIADDYMCISKSQYRPEWLPNLKYSLECTEQEYWTL